jgi:hypothetical protein
MNFTPLDTVVTLISVSISFFGSYYLGKLFGVRAVWNRILVGLLIVSGVSSIFVFVNQNFVRPAILLGIAFGWALAFRSLKNFLHIKIIKDFIRNFQFPTQTASYISVFTFVFSIFMCFRFFPWFYLFENHDVMYYGWVSSFWNHSPDGSVQVPTAFPLTLGGTHTLPAVFLSAATSLLPDVNLVQLIFTKALFITITLYSFCHSLFSRNSSKSPQVLAGLLVGIVIYGQDFGYELTISSYLYIIVLIQIIRAIIWQEEDATTTTILISFLVIAKIPLFLIGIGCLLVWLILQRRVLFLRKLLIPIILLPIHFLLTLQAPKSPSTIDVDFSILGFFFSNPNSWTIQIWLNSFGAVVGWNVDWMRFIFFRENISGVFLPIIIVTYTVFIVYFIYLFIRKEAFSLNEKIESNTKDYLLIDTFMILSLISWIFLRNGTKVEIGHQAHAYLITSIITFMLVALWLTKVLNKWVSIAAIFLCTLGILEVGVGLNSLTIERRTTENSNSYVSLTDATVDLQHNGYYIPDRNEDMAKAQVVASMNGLKLQFASNATYVGSQVNNFIRIEEK